MKKFTTILLIASSMACGKSKQPVVTENEKSDKPPCEVVTSVPTSLEAEYRCTNTKYQMNIALNNTYRVINSQTEFNSLVTGTCLPNIDFSRFSLIIGKKGLTTGNRQINYSLTRDCPNNKSTLLVTLLNDFSATAPNITYHALVPKLNANEQVDVQVVIQ